MADSLALRMRYHLRHVESLVTRQLLVEAIELLEGPDFVPKVPHPGVGEVVAGGELTPADVHRWLAERDIALVPWQVKRLNEL